VREREKSASSNWIPVLLVAVTFATFAWVCGAEFVTWDDQIHVYGNPGLQIPTIRSLAWYWGHFYQNLYIPLTYSMWWVLALVARVPGVKGSTELNPWIYHTTSVLLQCVSVLLVWQLLRKLVRSDLAAAAGALLWAVHPLQVESVAWVSAGKDQLCGALAIGALILFMPTDSKKAEMPDGRRDVLATLLFVAALLAKPAAVVVPLMAGMLVLYFPHRPKRWRWLGLWAALAFVDVVITHFAQPVMAPADGGRWWLRPMIAADSVQFYLSKLVAPVWLMIQYNRDPAMVIAKRWTEPRWIVPIAVFVLAWLGRKRFPYLFVGLMIFVLGLLPVLGLVPFKFQEQSDVADHYAHLALLGPALAVAWGLSVTPKRGRMVAAVLAGVVLLGLAITSMMQTLVWKDSYTLYQYTLRVNGESWIAANNLGNIYQAADHDQEAIKFFELALRYQKNYPNLWTNYGNSLAKTGQYAKAELAYRQANRLNPDEPSLKRNWALERELAKEHHISTTEPATAPSP
jgi:hypothetical protein